MIGHDSNGKKHDIFQTDLIHVFSFKNVCAGVYRTVC